MPVRLPFVLSSVLSLDAVSIRSAVRFVLTQPMPFGCAGDSFLERSRSLIVRYSKVPLT